MTAATLACLLAETVRWWRAAGFLGATVDVRDLSCSPHPLLGLSLHAIEVEDGSTSTIFIDAMRAAAALPEELRHRLKDLHSLNLWPRSLSGDG